MPTPPHRAREVAESFGVDAARYDRTRPGYPAALVDAVVAASPGHDVLDVGTGTGIAARQLRDAGCRVLGVEPDPRMAAFARNTGLDVEVSTFEAWDAAGRTFDTVTAGQTWHWVDPVVGASRAAAVLRPGGQIALFWNGVQPRPDAVAAFGDVVRRVLPAEIADRMASVGGAVSDAYRQMADGAAEGISTAGGFAAAGTRTFTWTHRYHRDEWLDQLPTLGLYTRLPPDTLDALLTGTGAAIDALGGVVDVEGTTVPLTATRVG